MINHVGRKLYYEKTTGAVIHDTGERMGTDIRQSTVEEDFQYVMDLQRYTKDGLGVLFLEVGEHSDDFATMYAYRVNPETEKLEFTKQADFNGYDFGKSTNDKLADIEAAVLELAMLMTGGNG